VHVHLCACVYMCVRQHSQVVWESIGRWCRFDSWPGFLLLFFFFLNKEGTLLTLLQSAQLLNRDLVVTRQAAVTLMDN